MFQSPRTGKFESNFRCCSCKMWLLQQLFQSPRTGKFESNEKEVGIVEQKQFTVSIP